MNPLTLAAFEEFIQDSETKKWIGLKSHDMVSMNDLRPWAHVVEEHVRDDYSVIVYELSGSRYELFYRKTLGTWTTPAGEIRPCTQKTKVLSRLIVRKIQYGRSEVAGVAMPPQIRENCTG